VTAAAVETPSPVTTLAARTWLRRLDDSFDEAETGGKAATLSRLIAHGVAVPNGLVLTTAAFSRWLDAAGLRGAADALAAGMTAADPRHLAAAGEAIRTQALRSAMPAEIDRALDEAFDALAAEAPLAVRSSAVGEDGRRASFAGQLDSVLHVRTRADLGRAVRQCWASCWSDRALAYRHARGISIDRAAVIIQRQIAPVVAGVLFTRDPQAWTLMVAEYVQGLADGLVSGEVEPHRVRVRRDDVERGRVVDLPPAIAGAGLVPLALRLERLLDGPQDIEWAVDERRALWIVQSRPITTAPPARRAPAQPTCWSNANINENFPGPISPLLYSIASTGYYHYFRNLGLAFGVSRRRLHAMDAALRGIVGVHGARLYYNLTNVHAVLRMAPFGEALAGAFNRFTGAGETPSSPPAVAARPGNRVAQTLELVRIALCTAWQYALLRRRIETFEQEADRFAAATRRDALARATLAELASHLRRFIDIRQHRWKNASLADAAAMVGYALLERATRGLTPAAAGDSSLHNRLLRALPGVPSAQPPVRLWALARLIRRDPVLTGVFRAGDAGAALHAIRTDSRFAEFRDALQRYLDEWGFRSSAELMLTVPTLEEDPRPLVALLARHALEPDDGSPAAAMARQAAARVAETRRVLRSQIRRAPHRALALWATLAVTRRAIAYRERARLKQALLYTRCRAIAREIGRRLEAGGRLTAADDVFMLRWEEIDELLSGRSMFPDVRPLLRLRAGEHARCSTWTPPDAFVLERGEHWRPEDAAGLDDAAPPAAEPGALRGTSACGGIVTARAAVLTGVEEAHRLEKGDVLVTRQTDPGWAPVFCLIGGLVIERGGMLSHGAVIAREFGLPCIVGVREATQRIPHGRLVTVDGDAGTCVVGGPAGEAS
jgi:pyruvate,water dikinase